MLGANVIVFYRSWLKGLDGRLLASIDYLPLPSPMTAPATHLIESRRWNRDQAKQFTHFRTYSFSVRYHPNDAADSRASSLRKRNIRTHFKLTLSISACVVKDLTPKHSPCANVFLKHAHWVVPRLPAMLSSYGPRGHDWPSPIPIYPFSLRSDWATIP